jgi:hypothetical protein
MLTLQQVSDLYEIQLLKARYFRYMDLKMWDDWRDIFTDDFEMHIDNSKVPLPSEPTVKGADAFAAYMAQSVPEKITIHHGHMPEIEFVDENTATGIWAMYDWVDDPGRGFASQGYGHYHERYVRCPDGKWRIEETHLTRLRVNDVPHKPSDRSPSLDPKMLSSVAHLRQ